MKGLSVQFETQFMTTNPTTAEHFKKFVCVFNIFMLLHTGKQLSQNSCHEIAKYFKGPYGSLLDRNVGLPIMDTNFNQNHLIHQNAQVHRNLTWQMNVRTYNVQSCNWVCIQIYIWILEANKSEYELCTVYLHYTHVTFNNCWVFLCVCVFNKCTFWPKFFLCFELVMGKCCCSESNLQKCRP